MYRGEIQVLAERYFGDTGPQNVAIAVAVALAESGGDHTIIGDNYPRWQSEYSIYRFDYGLMQVNSVHGFDPNLLISDADYNMACARQVWNSQGWNAWATFKGGQYLAHYQEPVLPPEAPVTPPMLSINDTYLAVTDTFYPAFNSQSDSRLVPVRYEQVGDRRYAVYELWVQG